MKLVLIDGGPASGKNTLGTLLIQEFQKINNRTILLDLDNYVEKLNPSWIWDDKQKEEKDQSKARENFIRDINKNLQQDFIVIAFGERFLTREDVINFMSKLNITYPVYLFHLNPPFEIRRQRLLQRGPNILIDLEKDQRERELNTKWYGYIYKNISTAEIDALNLFELIQKGQGLLDKKIKA